jgi:hypothetical protein
MNYETAKFINGGKRIGTVDTPQECQEMALRLAPMFAGANWKWAVRCEPGTSVGEWRRRHRVPDASTILIHIVKAVGSLSDRDGDWCASGGLCICRDDGHLWLEASNDLVDAPQEQDKPK